MKEMKFCPLCGAKIDQYHEVPFDKPYTHIDPMKGLLIYGPYSADKETICYKENILHFAFILEDGSLEDHRLVKLNVTQE